MVRSSTTSASTTASTAHLPSTSSRSSTSPGSTNLPPKSPHTYTNPPRRAQSSLTVPDALKRTSTSSTASTASSRRSTRPPFSAGLVASKPAASPIITATKRATVRRTASLDPRTLSTASAAPANSSFAASRNALRSRDRNAALSSRPPLHHPTITLHRSPSTSSLTSTISSLSVNSSVLSPRLAKTPYIPKTQTPTSATMRPLKAPSGMGYKEDNTPRKPTLASRPYGRTPLTPKIASQTTTSGITPSLAAPGIRTPTTAGPGSQPQGQSTSPYQTVTVTPLARRTTGLSSTSHNDVASPVPPYLNNITPRSGSRQSRVESTTPTGTPTHTGLGIAGSGSADPDSKFFYASDANPSSSASTPALPTLAASPALGSMSRASTFFYANGKSLPGTTAGSNSNASPAPTPPLASPIHIPPTDHLASKFVHANGDAIDRKPSLTQPPKLAAAGLVSASSPALVQTSQQSLPPSQNNSRPMSPVKLASYPLQRSDSTRSGVMPASLSLNAATTASPPLGPASPGNTNTSANLLSRSRSTFSASVGSNSSSNGGHSRKASLTVADPPTVARLMQSSQPNSETSSPASAHPAGYPFPAVGGLPGTATSGLASLLQAADDFGDDTGDEDEEHANASGDDADHNNDKTSNVHSNAGTDDSAKDSDGNPLDDLVKNARRERKVQDLEITNASLEAINRSLERQLRKQKAEIRQFRRLSRAGRLSSAPNASKPSAIQPPTGTSRITSSSTVEGPLQDTDHILAMGDDGLDHEYPSDMEASFEEEEDDDLEDLDEDEEDSDENISSDKNSTRRRRDERRMQLDLSKHRQLLVDSQKINQSIKRCMNWTEELINEGKKALAFQVRVSEVQLGGRVLAEDEVEERRQKREEREKLGLGATLPVDHDANSMLGDGGSTLGVSDMGSVAGDGSTAADDTLRLDDLNLKDFDPEEVSADDASTFSAVDVDTEYKSEYSEFKATSPLETPSFALQLPPDEPGESDTQDESFSPVTHSRTVRFDDEDVPPADGLPLASTSTTPKPAQGPFMIPA